MHLLLQRRCLLPALDHPIAAITTDERACVLFFCYLGVASTNQNKSKQSNQIKQALEQFSTDAADTENDPAKESIFDEKVCVCGRGCLHEVQPSTV